jgi:hypothetical protein
MLQLGPAVRIELVEDGGDVNRHGVDGDSQPTRDRFIRGTIYHRGNHLEVRLRAPRGNREYRQREDAIGVKEAIARKSATIDLSRIRRRLTLNRRMSNPLSRIAVRIAYGASQLPRVAWYVGHGLAVRRLSEAAQRQDSPGAKPRAHTDVHVPDQRRLYADMAALLRQDLANVEAGIYPIPADHDGSLLTLLDRSRLFFEDLPEIHRRRARGGHREVLSDKIRGRRPSYYLQNFHFQSGGWMTDASARRYDTQVEVLFKGMANATRRQALPQLHEAFAGHDQRRLRLLDVGCGTGRFLDFLKQTWPRLPALGLDLSEPYIRHAKLHLQRWSRVNFVVANAEQMPVPDESQDAVTSIFMLHELPPKVRRVLGFFDESRSRRWIVNKRLTCTVRFDL